MSKRRDRRLLAYAFDLAWLNDGETGENPSVGCVITDAMGHIVGDGTTGEGGRPHAEQLALDMAGDRARGGTAYVTLEPCRERSTGEDACSTRLIAAGIKRVVCPAADQHPKGAGGFAVLRAAGIAVSVGLKRDQAEWMYSAFFKKQA